MPSNVILFLFSILLINDMKSDINKLTEFLVNLFGEDYCAKTIYETSSYVSILYSILTLSQCRSIDIDTSNIESTREFEIINKRFPMLCENYRKVKLLLSIEEQTNIDSLVRKVASNTKEENIVSLIYQTLKTTLLKDALKKIGRENNKMVGKDALFQTQFFTDQYMSDYLIDKVFSLNEESVDKMVFVDPASGGANILVRVFNRLFSYYRNATSLSAQEIVDTILRNQIIGYDLDYELSSISSLSLFVSASKYAMPSNDTPIYIYGGVSGDNYGFMSNSVKSNNVRNISFASKLSDAKNGNIVVYITNPPFMGKRDMDICLKQYLMDKYPESKGDMCFSFMQQILTNLRNEDMMATVSQNGWMNLSSLKDFRGLLLSNYHLCYCVDLGSNAFKQINGEKTNVVLCVFDKGTSCLSKFANLRNMSLTSKISKLYDYTLPYYSVNQSLFKSNNSFEFNYLLKDDISFLRLMPTYSSFAKCMQGSSTGDNKQMVKYIWEIDNPDWKMASKGGGFSKWAGLSYYKVKWGRNGECIKNNPGGALRNESRIKETALVYSDTGTLGLNVRKFQDDQVFIASGPGISVSEGDFLNHLAFLNSKPVSFLLKILNPKYSISAGYIGKLPISGTVLNNSELALMAEQCLHLKHTFLSHKLPNAEFVHEDYHNIDYINQYISGTIVNDMDNYYQRLVIEKHIDDIILKSYNFSKGLLDSYREHVVPQIAEYQAEKLNIDLIDNILADSININCMPISRKLDGLIVGSENVIEIISSKTGERAETVYKFIIHNVSKLIKTRGKYELDLYHKMILKSLNITNLSHVKIPSFPLTEESLVKHLQHDYPFLNINNDTMNHFVSIIKYHHPLSFMNKPIIRIQ